MKRTIVPKRMLLGVLFVFTALSPRAQSPNGSTFSLSPGDVTEATIGTSEGSRLLVTLTPQKSAEFRAFTRANRCRSLAWKMTGGELVPAFGIGGLVFTALGGLLLAATGLR